MAFYVFLSFKHIRSPITSEKRHSIECLNVLAFCWNLSYVCMRRTNTNIMRPQTFSTDELQRHLEKHTIASMPEMKKALGTSVDMTVFRKLGILGYHASYSHRGKYYTLSQTAQFDERGLWSFGEVRFSKHGTLRTTAETFVNDSLAGYTAGELRRELFVEVKGTLLDLVRNDRIGRKDFGGEYVYISAVPAISRRQIMTREDKQSESLNPLVAEDGPVLAHHLRASIILFVSLLDEKQRRLWAGLESMRIGHGGDRAIAQLLGITPLTVAKGRQELLNRDVEIEHIRRSGGGRLAIKKNAGNHRENP
jgi:hypothetical protein